MGSSAIVTSQNLWWIVGGDTNGKSTQLWGGDPPTEITSPELPEILNQACIVTISNNEALVIAFPKLIQSPTNMAWIIDFSSQTWTPVSSTLKLRKSPACGLIKTDSGEFVVLAGGSSESSTEILDLATMAWTMGPSLSEEIEKGRMVSVNNYQEVLLIGGYNEVQQKVLTSIWRLNSTMDSWQDVGQLSSARFDPVAFSVTSGVLPSLCTATTTTKTTTSTASSTTTTPPGTVTRRTRGRRILL